MLEVPTVATAPTVYGIETSAVWFTAVGTKVATEPTVYGIETRMGGNIQEKLYQKVATAPTVYGIETRPI